MRLQTVLSRRSLLPLAAVVLLAGCGDSGKSGAGSGAPAKIDGPTIAVIPKGLTHVFWQSVHAGADKAGAEVKVNIKWDGPQKESDTSGQIAVVENAIASKVDGIVLAPLDKAALANVVKKAKEGNIPVVIFDSAIDLPDTEYVSFVATDNKKGGELAADRMGEILGGKGKVVVVPNQANSASTMDREEGFESRIKAKFPGIKLVRSNYCNSDRSQALKVIEDALTANPDAAGVFGSCEPSAVGALQAIKNRNLAGKVKVIGFDITDQLEDAVVAGTLDALVIQNPEKMGYEGVKAAVEAKQGKTPAKVIDTGVVLMTKENMETPDVKAVRPPRGKMN
ncbi:MAG: substrate-binding domain-containing protein [Armatimonadota bacterium]